MNPSLGKIRELRVRAVKVPMVQPHRTASGIITESPLVLTDVLTEDGVVGHSMVFTYTVAALKPTAELIKNLETLIVGEPLAPAEIAQRLARRFRERARHQPHQSEDRAVLRNLLAAVHQRERSACEREAVRVGLRFHRDYDGGERDRRARGWPLCRGGEAQPPRS